jgi:hypothetical protein
VVTDPAHPFHKFGTGNLQTLRDVPKEMGLDVPQVGTMLLLEFDPPTRLPVRPAGRPPARPPARPPSRPPARPPARLPTSPPLPTSPTPRRREF